MRHHGESEKVFFIVSYSPFLSLSLSLSFSLSLSLFPLSNGSLYNLHPIVRFRSRNKKDNFKKSKF